MVLKTTKIGLHIIPLLIKGECRNHSIEQFKNNNGEGVVDAVFVRYSLFIA